MIVDHPVRRRIVLHLIVAGNIGLTSALGVHFNGMGETRDDAYMSGIDAVVDDGNLSTGGFRKLAGDRYYFILED